MSHLKLHKSKVIDIFSALTETELELPTFIGKIIENSEEC